VHEAVVGGVVDAFEVFQVTGVGECIQVDDAILRMVLDPVADEVCADETGSAAMAVDMIRNVSVISSSRWMPRHRDVVPGSPQNLRAACLPETIW